jgi:hypothetical protein
MDPSGENSSASHDGSRSLLASTSSVNWTTATGAAADLLVQPSTMEGMPNAVLEALALGTPVLATTDLTVLTPLAEEVGPVALRLVPRNRLAAALGEIAPLASPPPRRSLLPARFIITTVVAELLAALGDTNGPPDA